MRAKGFSLLELLTVLCIIAMISAISFPLLKPLFQQSHDEIVKMQVLHAIQLAMEESQRRHLPVSLKKSDKLFIFIDEQADGIIKHPDDILFTEILDEKKGLLFWRSYPNYRSFLHFIPDAPLSQDNGTIWYCHPKATSPVWAITFSRAGNTRVLNAREGKIRDAEGKLISCRNPQERRTSGDPR